MIETLYTPLHGVPHLGVAWLQGGTFDLHVIFPLRPNRSRKDNDSMEMGERKVSISDGNGGDSPSDDKRRRVYSEILSPRRLLELTQAMDSIELEQTLSKVPLFNTLRSEEVSKLAKGLQYIVVEDGEFVYRQVNVSVFHCSLCGMTESLQLWGGTPFG